MNLSANQFKPVYDMLGIDTKELGCVMLDTEPIIVTDIIDQNDLYVNVDDPDSHAQGSPSEVVPHVTLLNGLLHKGSIIKSHIDQILSGWQIPDTVTIENVEFFYGNPEKPNIVIVAKVAISDALLEGNARMRRLPNIQTYPEYKPHITLAYVEDTADFETYISKLNEKLSGQTVKVVGLNYGD